MTSETKRRFSRNE